MQNDLSPDAERTLKKFFGIFIGTLFLYVTIYGGCEAYRVRNGVVGEAVKGATLIGDGATALRQIRAIGNDMALDPGIGNCGKAGQWVPVGVGQPTLLIGGLTIGGQGG